MLRVLTLNIAAVTPGWDERRREATAWLDRLRPDVVCLQEVLGAPSGRTTAHELAEGARGDWHVAFAGSVMAGTTPMPVAEGTSFGVAVMSRWPVDDTASRVLDVPEAGWANWHVVHARTFGLDVFSTHLEAHPGRGPWRERQVLEIDDFVRERSSPESPLPPILGGDCNARPDTTEMRFLAGLASIDGRSTYFQDAWRCVRGNDPGYTWDNRNPHAAMLNVHDQRIDYVYVGDSFGRGEALVPMGIGDGTGRVESARIVCDRSITGTLASDHYGLLVEIAWPDRPG